MVYTLCRLLEQSSLRGVGVFIRPNTSEANLYYQHERLCDIVGATTHTAPCGAKPHG